MNQIEVETWLSNTLNVSRETFAMLEMLHRATVLANSTQNLVAASTLPAFWNRHILDSAQLLPLAASAPAGPWIDLGSGAGFPGLVVALLTDRPVILAEERRKRIEHLEGMIAMLGLQEGVSVMRGRVERQSAGPFSVISARAFAPLDRLFEMSHHLSSSKTIWLLPKGRSAASELEAASRTWQGSFRIEPSLSDPDSAIIVATRVQPRRRP